MLAASMDSYLENLNPELDPGMLEMILIVYGGFLLLTLAFAVVSYVLHSVGLYTIARRRRIPRPWLAWLPFGGSWILGSISDRYQFVRRKRFRNRKKLLVCMEVAVYALGGAITFFLGSLMINMQWEQGTGMVPHWTVVNGEKVLYGYTIQEIMTPPRQDNILAAAQLVVALIFVTILVILIFFIFQHLAYYDVYASCRPDLKVVFLILGILFPVTLPFFVFACRKHDLGMEDPGSAGEKSSPHVAGQVFSAGP